MNINAQGISIGPTIQTNPAEFGYAKPTIYDTLSHLLDSLIRAHAPDGIIIIGKDIFFYMTNVQDENIKSTDCNAAIENLGEITCNPLNFGVITTNPYCIKDTIIWRFVINEGHSYTYPQLDTTSIVPIFYGGVTPSDGERHYKSQPIKK